MKQIFALTAIILFNTAAGAAQAPAQEPPKLGVPDEDALTPGRAGGGTSWAPIGASLGAVVLLGVGLAVASRRRAEVAPAAG